jgi:hypothetical protein
VSDSLADQIAELPKMTRAELQAKWRLALKQAPPPHLDKPLLVPLPPTSYRSKHMAASNRRRSDGFTNWPGALNAAPRARLGPRSLSSSRERG